MEFVEFPSGVFEIGWRHDDALTAEARSGIEAFMPWTSVLERFSAARQVELSAFAMATTTLSAEELLEDLDDDDDLLSIAELCDALDQRLADRGLRVPTEDEVEVACGGGLFPWGERLPDGIPWGDQTTFREHKEANSHGLQLNSNPYVVEITRAAFKLGDGGEAICGGYPWPVPWLSFCPAYRLVGEQAEDLLYEFLEDARVRPVRL